MTASPSVASSVPSLSFTDLLTLARKTPNPEAAETLLRRSRVMRVILFGPAKGGKTSLLRGLSALGRCSVASLDGDITPAPGVDVDVLRHPTSHAEIPLLKGAYNAYLSRVGEAWGTASESAVNCLDTLTTLHTILNSLVTRDDPMLGLTRSNMEEMRVNTAISRACNAWVDGLFLLSEPAARLSQKDGPLVFVVTEHAKVLTRQETHPKYDPEGNVKVDMRFSMWAPSILGVTGNKVHAQADIIMGVSIDQGPHGAKSFRVTCRNHTYCDARLTDDEWTTFDATMAGTERNRLALSLRALWERRKVSWQLQHRIGPAYEALRTKK